MARDFSAVLDRLPDDRSPAPGTRRIGPWQVRLDAADGALVSRPELDLHVLVKGCLYGATPDDLLDAYLHGGRDFPRTIEGHYAALILDGPAGRVLAVADRVGSQAMYAAHTPQHVLVSTRPDWAPFRERPLDLEGVSAYLTKGSLLGGVTLRQGVGVLRRACVHDLGGSHVCTHEYWPLTFTGPQAGASMADLEAEFAHLIRGAMTRRIQASGGRAYLSLSGGYDSRGLLSVLTSLGADVRTFSYALDARAPGSDAQVAHRLAAQYSTRHTVLGAYHGSVLGNVRRNVAWGGGGAPLCDEADAWADFAALNPSDVFVGDHAFDINSHPLSLHADQLLRQKVPPSFGILAWLRPTLPPTTYAAIQGAWEQTLAGVLAQAGAGPDRNLTGYPLEIALMLDVNVGHSLLPWRDRFAGHTAHVHLPYLDGALLDFTRRLPLEVLARKAMFRRVLHTLDPHLMRVPLARSLGYVPDWTAELIAQRAEIWGHVQATSSPLDDVIPPDVIHALLLELAPTPRSVQLRGAARQTLGRLRRTPLGLRVFGPAPIRKTVDAATFLRRVLTVRAVVAGGAGSVLQDGEGTRARPAGLTWAAGD